MLTYNMINNFKLISKFYTIRLNKLFAKKFYKLVKNLLTIICLFTDEKWNRKKFILVAEEFNESLIGACINTHWNL